MGEAPPPSTSTGPNWWKSTSVYQIWPASYKDSNGDGVGDLQGIISTIPYLDSIGVETVWLSPMYASPQKDMGYDISNYEDIHPAYGTLADMQELIDGLHARGMKIILDLVINHTSDEHAWFKKSRSDKVNDKADWYMWKDPRYDEDGNRQPPNNWRSFFGGSAWKYVEKRDQYYLHLFAEGQPDLNWENPVTRKAVYASAMRFWLDRGVDGWRIDTCNIYSKVRGLPDAPITEPAEEFQNPGAMVNDGPRAHEYLKEMRRVCDEYGERLMVGELGLMDSKEKILKYVDAGRKELSEVFEFRLVTLGRSFSGYHDAKPFLLSEVKKALEYSQTLIDGTNAWTTVFGENHDQARSISRFATRDERWHVQAGKLLATLFATLSGTLFLYQGQEIGMSNIPRDWDASEYKDVEAINYLRKIKAEHPDDKAFFEKAMDGLNLQGRDNARTPVQWDASDHAGFTTGTPWMRVNDNYPTYNVAAAEEDPASILNHWRKMLSLRQQHADLFVFGSFEVLDMNNQSTFTFFKQGRAGRRALVQLNFSSEEQDSFGPLESGGRDGANCLLSSSSGKEGARGKGRLAPWEARVHVLNDM